jgi:hypothetical protein
LQESGEADIASPPGDADWFHVEAGTASWPTVLAVLFGGLAALWGGLTRRAEEAGSS